MEHNALPSQFLDLPAVENVIWSANFRQAHAAIRSAYCSAVAILYREDSDPLRLRFHLDRLLDEVFPILVAIEEQAENPVPGEWLAAAAGMLSATVAQLHSALRNTNEQYV